MAAPTISAITPSTVAPAAEAMIKIDGSGYNIPAIPVPDAQYPGVRVWVDGRESAVVRNVTDAILYVQVPRYLGDPDSLPAAVDVRIANIAADGSIVPGEDVTFTDVLTYQTEDVRAPAEQPFFELCLREFSREVRRQLGIPCAFAIVPDYQDEVTLEYYEAEVPSLGVRRFTIRDYPYRDKYGRVEVSLGGSPDEATLHRDKEEGEFVLDLILVAETKDEVFRYFKAVRLLAQRTTRLLVPDGEGSSDRVSVRLTLDLEGEVGFNTRDVLASVTFQAVLGPIPIEAPEVLDRAWENLTIDVDARNAL